jgi:hypothetical protein
MVFYDHIIASTSSNSVNDLMIWRFWEKNWKWIWNDMNIYIYIYIYTVPHNHPNSGGWSLIFCQVISARVGWVYNPLHCRRWLSDSYRIASIQSAGAVLSLWHRHISLGPRASAMRVAWWHDGNWGSRPICGKSGAVGRSLADNAGPSNQYTSRTFKVWNRLNMIFLCWLLVGSHVFGLAERVQTVDVTSQAYCISGLVWLYLRGSLTCQSATKLCA